MKEEKKVKTSLALIGHNEIQGLKDLVGDVGKYFDEIILVSTAHNKEFIKEAKKLKVKVYDEFFGKTGVDFDASAARNSSFKHATGELIGWFDLDDRVPNGDVIPDIFEAMEKLDWVYCMYNYAFDQYGDVIVKHLKPRFMRKGSGHWQTTPHDDFVPDKSVKTAIDTEFLIEGLQVNHQNFYGKSDDVERMRARAKRNLGIMAKELERDGDKTDLRTIQYIGKTLMTLEDYKNAIAFLMRHFKSTGAKEDRFWSLKWAAWCHKQLGEYEQAINLLLEGLKFYPEWQTIYFELANVYSAMGKHHKVIEWTLCGIDKQVPNTAQIMEPQDYDLNPMGRLADAYLMIKDYDKALKIANALKKKYPKNEYVKELVETSECAVHTEGFVVSFLAIVDEIRKHDRLKAIKLFDCLPNRLDEDIRIQTERQLIVPPKQWSDKSIVIYCGNALEDWAYPSLFTGVGGSEAAVLFMSQELTKLGYKVTIYNKCGDLRGIYDGVEYLPFYHFNPSDNFNIVIGWRNPRMFENIIRAKKKIVWLHDIAAGWQFSDAGTKNVDKFIFLSKWHRSNMPKIPESKVFLSNNGIDPEQFKDKLPEKKKELVLTCSYDRGVLTLIRDIMPMVHKKLGYKVPTHICYGWNNIDKELEILPELKTLREELTPLLEQDWVIHHGRINEKEVAQLTKECIIYPYSTEFGETQNISSMKSQISGCYVLTTTNSGGTPERLRFGEAMPLNNIYTNKKQQEQYADRLVELIKNPPKIDEEKRQEIIKEFSWKKTAAEWDKNILQV